MEKTKKEINQPKRILIFNVNWIGDVLFSTAVIRNIRRNYPDSFIACVIPSRCYPVLKGNPHVDEVIIFDQKDRHKSVLSKLAFVRLLKHRKFDQAILLHGSLTRALICRIAGIPERIGYDTKKRGFLLTKKIPLPALEGLHRIDYYLNIIEKAGIRAEDRYLEFFYTQEDQDCVEEFLKKNGVDKNDYLIGINPGGNWLPKRWPPAYWAELADKLISDLKAKVIITGGSQDLKIADSIARQMHQKPLITCSKFNLKQSAALFGRLNLFVTCDSGPLHIANAVGTKKIIALFGPTDPNITGPFPLTNVTILRKNIDCKIPCYVVDCKDNHCMKAITPDDLIKTIKGLT